MDPLLFAGSNFVIVGKYINKTHSQIKDIVKMNGGKTFATVSRKTDFVIVPNNSEETLNHSTVIKAINLGKPVLLSSFLEDSINMQTIRDISSYQINTLERKKRKERTRNRQLNNTPTLRYQLQPKRRENQAFQSLGINKPKKALLPKKLTMQNKVLMKSDISLHDFSLINYALNSINGRKWVKKPLKKGKNTVFKVSDIKETNSKQKPLRNSNMIKSQKNVINVNSIKNEQHKNEEIYAPEMQQLTIEEENMLSSLSLDQDQEDDWSEHPRTELFENPLEPNPNINIFDPYDDIYRII